MQRARVVQAVKYLIHVGLAVAVLGYVALSVVDAQVRSAAAMRESATAFLNSLSAEQKAKAMMGVADGRRIEWHYVPRERKGLAVRDMTQAQKQLALALVDTIGPIGSKKVRAIMLLDNLLRQLEPQKIFFAWTGSTKRAERYYYRVQRPTFLIEHDHSQAVSGSIADQTPNHIHNVWREFDGDFGEDLLRRHYESSAHAAPLVRDEAVATQ